MPKKSKNQIDIVEEYEPELEVEKDAGKDVEKEIKISKRTGKPVRELSELQKETLRKGRELAVAKRKELIVGIDLEKRALNIKKAKEEMQNAKLEKQKKMYEDAVKDDEEDTEEVVPVANKRNEKK